MLQTSWSIIRIKVAIISSKRLGNYKRVDLIRVPNGLKVAGVVLKGQLFTAEVSLLLLIKLIYVLAHLLGPFLLRNEVLLLVQMTCGVVDYRHFFNLRSPDFNRCRWSILFTLIITALIRTTTFTATKFIFFIVLVLKGLLRSVLVIILMIIFLMWVLLTFLLSHSEDSTFSLSNFVL